LYYKETGIAVLYDDTVAKDPLVVIDLGYHLTNIDSLVQFTEIEKEADVMQGLDFIKDKIVPYLGKGLKPYSFFLTDSLYTYSSPYSTDKVLLHSYHGLNTVAVGFCAEIKDLDAEQLKEKQMAIFREILITHLNTDFHLLTDFNSVSALYYGKNATGTSTSGDYIPYRKKEEYGLLSDGTESDTYYSTGTQAEDLDRYVSVMLHTTEAAFTTQYGSYPLVMKKYKLLRAAFKTLNFTMPL
jgi:hypothetical protein